MRGKGSLVRRRNIRNAAEVRRAIRGGFIQAIIPALTAAHMAAREYKPLTRLSELADVAGVSNKISAAVDKLPGGGLLKKAWSFARNTLGYGRRKRKARKGKAPKAHRVKAHMRKVGRGKRVRVKGHLQKNPKRR